MKTIKKQEQNFQQTENNSKTSKAFKISLFLDDERFPIDVYWTQYSPLSLFHHQEKNQPIVVRNFLSFVKFIQNNIKTGEDLKKLEISFDHDLADFYYYAQFKEFAHFIDLLKSFEEQIHLIYTNFSKEFNSINDSFFDLFLKNNFIEERDCVNLVKDKKETTTLIKEIAFFDLHSSLETLKEQFQFFSNFYFSYLEQCFEEEKPIVFSLEEQKDIENTQKELSQFVECFSDEEFQQTLNNNIKTIEKQTNQEFNSFIEVIEFVLLFNKYKKSNEMTGFSCLQFFIDYLLDNEKVLNLKENFLVENYYIHSMNNIKKNQMNSFLQQFKEMIKKEQGQNYGNLEL